MKLYSYLIFLVGFIIDILLATFLPFDFTYQTISFVPCFTLVFLVLSTRYLDKKTVYISAVIIGIITDVFFADFLVVYLLTYVVSIYFCYILEKNLNSTFFEFLFLSISTFLFKECLLYFFLRIVSYSKVPFLLFITNRVLLSILVLIIALIIGRTLFRDAEQYFVQSNKSKIMREKVWWIK